MNEISLGLRGTAKWFEFVGCDMSRPQRAPQASVLEAVRFVMEQLRPEIRGSAWIDTNAGCLGIGGIVHITSADPFPERRGLEDMTLGPTAYLAAKAKGDRSMPSKRERSKTLTIPSCKARAIR